MAFISYLNEKGGVADHIRYTGRAWKLDHMADRSASQSTWSLALGFEAGILTSPLNSVL
jgi:hypothetical protein